MDKRIWNRILGDLGARMNTWFRPSCSGLSFFFFFFFFFNAVLFLEAKILLRKPLHSRNQARSASWFKLPIGDRILSADDTPTHKISGSLFWPEVTPDWDSSWEKKLWGLAHRKTWELLTFSECFCGFTLSGAGPELCGCMVFQLWHYFKIWAFHSGLHIT